MWLRFLLCTSVITYFDLEKCDEKIKTITGRTLKEDEIIGITLECEKNL